jgi:O-antigen/teichoic acid export membrane protein
LSTLRTFAGQTAVYGISTIVSRLLNFILTPIYVRIYEVKVYGIFTYMYSWASMLNAILAFGMETTFFRYLNKHPENKARVYDTTFLTVATTAFLFLLFTFFFVDDIAAWIQSGKTYNPDYAIFVKYFVYILVVDALAVIPFAKVRADGRAMRYGIIKFVNILTFIAFNFIFIFVIPFIIEHKGWGADSLASWYRPGWVAYVFISNLIASLVTLILLLPELLQFRLKPDASLLKEMIVYSLPVLVANISFIINENVDKIFLGMLLPANISEQQVGIYGACAKLAIFLSIFVQAFRLGAEPFFFSHAKNKNSGETYARIMNYFVIAVAWIFVALVANIEILKYFIMGKDEVQQAIYWSGLQIVPVLLLGYVSLGIYMNLSIWYKLSDQTRFGLYISSVGASLTIILNLVFIPEYGYIASAWISLAAYGSMMILSYLLGQKNYPIPYNIKKNAGYLVAAIIIVYVAFSVFNRNLIIGNLLFLIFILATVYVERKELKAIFNIKS